MSILLANWKFAAMGALALLAGWFYLEWGNAEKEADLYEARLAVSNASIEALTAEANERMREARERDERARQVAEDARRDAERFARDRQALEGAISSLTGIVGRLRDNPGQCEVDSEVVDALEGL